VAVQTGGFVLQVLRGCLNVALGTCYDLGEESHLKMAAIMNNISLGLGILTSLVNAAISAFDMSESKLGWGKKT
jgi:hypothetical protein